jgi:hypothetical protein
LTHYSAASFFISAGSFGKLLATSMKMGRLTDSATSAPDTAQKMWDHSLLCVQEFRVLSELGSKASTDLYAQEDELDT